MKNALSVIFSYTTIYTIFPIFVIIINTLYHNYIFLSIYILTYYLICIYVFNNLVNRLREEFEQLYVFLCINYIFIEYFFINSYYVLIVKKYIKKYIVEYKLIKIKKKNGKTYESFR